MPIRPFKLPEDIAVLAEVLPPAFQYPENAGWSIQADEMESMADLLHGVRRLWPLLRLARIVVPSLRDAMHGFIWEEEGPAGVINVLRKGASNTWLIGNVAVLPEYRRRGIARQLVEAGIALARERGADRLTLDVVEGNVPACALYERLGFVRYTGAVQYLYEGEPPAPRPLPPGYTLEPLSSGDWRTRYDLLRRITPGAVQVYEPVEEARYRRSGFLRLLSPLFARAQGVRPEAVILRAADGRVIATGRSYARIRAGGTNEVSLDLDPACPEAAAPLLAYLLAGVLRSAPGRRVEFEAPLWLTPVVEAADQLGLRRRCTLQRMGLRL